MLSLRNPAAEEARGGGKQFYSATQIKSGVRALLSPGVIPVRAGRLLLVDAGVCD